MRLVIIKEIVLKTKKKVVIKVYVVIIVNSLVITLMIVKTKGKRENLEIIIKVKLDVIIVKDLDITQEIVIKHNEIISKEVTKVINVTNVVKKVITQEIVSKLNEE